MNDPEFLQNIRTLASQNPVYDRRPPLKGGTRQTNGGSTRQEALGEDSQQIISDEQIAHLWSLAPADVKEAFGYVNDAEAR